MYLFFLFVVLTCFTNYSYANCGCNTNRNGLCRNKNNPSEIYSKETNENRILRKNQDSSTADMVLIEGGTFEMGTDEPVFQTDFEGPIRNVTLESFYLDRYEVSNQKFYDFVKETQYKTEAEVFGDSFLFQMSLPEDQRDKFEDIRAVQAPWWIKMEDVNWKHPEGPHSSIEDKMNHPVVHVSWNDAVSFCKHYGKRLPTEAEWEMACRGGLRQKLYPWGNKLNPKGEHWINIWQGTFPKENTAEDGYVFTCPVDKFPPNKFGLHNMAGNVWEWTQDDWQNDPESKVKKGGSFLCHESYCWRYRCAARSSNTKDSSAQNLGFRCAKNASE